MEDGGVRVEVKLGHTAVRVVPGRVHHDKQPRRRLAVDRSKVGREPLIL